MAAFSQAAEALKEYLYSQGIENVEISLSGDPPAQHPKSGKFKHIVNMSSAEDGRAR